MGNRFFQFLVICAVLCGHAYGFGIFGGRRYRGNYSSQNHNNYRNNGNHDDPNDEMYWPQRGFRNAEAKAKFDRDAREAAIAKDAERAEGEALRDNIKKFETVGKLIDPATVSEDVISRANCVRFVHYPVRKFGPFANNKAVEQFDVDVYPALVFMRTGKQLEAVVAPVRATISNVTDYLVKQYKANHLDPISKPGAPVTKTDNLGKPLEFDCAPKYDNDWKRVCKREVRQLTMIDPNTGEPVTKYLIHQRSENRYRLTDYRNVHHEDEMWCL